MKLPSIHTLLERPPSPPSHEHYQSDQLYPPSLHLHPASPSNTLSPMGSPTLSSTQSPSISSIGSISPMTMKLSEFPPIHGDDPPRRLVHSPKRSFTHYYHHTHSLHKTPSIHTESSPPTIVVSPSIEPKPSVPAPPPCTQIIIEPTTGQPILKRRRGRPPTRSPGYDEGGWTFLSPTVWNVTPASAHTEESKPSEDGMTDAMAAFTSDMHTVLPMPKKKRGRKPKHHHQGHSCFVWKDITAKSSS